MFANRLFHVTSNDMKIRSVRLLTVLLVGLSWCTTLSEATAQEALSRRGSGNFARNSIFLELGGNGVFYSLNYDHKIFNHFSARIGGMYAPWEDEISSQNASLLLVPLMANYLVGNGSSRLEVGAGLTFGNISGNLDGFDEFSEGGVAAFTSTVGYRLQPTNGGFLFRIGYTPTFFSDGVLHFIGLSLGGTF